MPRRATVRAGVGRGRAIHLHHDVLEDSNECIQYCFSIHQERQLDACKVSNRVDLYSKRISLGNFRVLRRINVHREQKVSFRSDTPYGAWRRRRMCCWMERNSRKGRVLRTARMRSMEQVKLSCVYRRALDSVFHERIALGSEKKVRSRLANESART